MVASVLQSPVKASWSRQVFRPLSGAHSPVQSAARTRAGASPVCPGFRSGFRHSVCFAFRHSLCSGSCSRQRMGRNCPDGRQSILAKQPLPYTVFLLLPCFVCFSCSFRRCLCRFHIDSSYLFFWLLPLCPLVFLLCLPFCFFLFLLLFCPGLDLFRCCFLLFCCCFLLFRFSFLLFPLYFFLYRLYFFLFFLRLLRFWLLFFLLWTPGLFLLLFQRFLRFAFRSYFFCLVRPLLFLPALKLFLASVSDFSPLSSPPQQRSSPHPPKWLCRNGLHSPPHEWKGRKNSCRGLPLPSTRSAFQKRAEFSRPFLETAFRFSAPHLPTADTPPRGFPPEQPFFTFTVRRHWLFLVSSLANPTIFAFQSALICIDI